MNNRTEDKKLGTFKLKLAKIYDIGITDLRRNSDRVLNLEDEVAGCRRFGNNYNDAMDCIGTHLFSLHVS